MLIVGKPIAVNGEFASSTGNAQVEIGSGRNLNQDAGQTVLTPNLKTEAADS